MKLNNDCVRDILLYLENTLDYDVFVDINDIQNNINKYNEKEVRYTMDKLIEVELIVGEYSDSEIEFIHEITFRGHQYLENIKDDKIWKLVKKETSNLKSVSITIMAEIAKNIILKQMS